MPGRQHEPVPAKPLVIARVMHHHLLEQQVRQRRQAHRRAGMAAAGLLHRIGGEQPDGINRAHVDVGPASPLGQRPEQRRVPVLQAGTRRVRRGPGLRVLAHDNLVSLEIGGRPAAAWPGRTTRARTSSDSYPASAA
jgi:hypothetical protein